jgi:succinate dehydrogenase / fumarate reductase cytochrome b subunit
MQDSRYRSWRRLHALSGAVPVAVFLVFHYATNAAAIAGPDAFNRLAGKLEDLPWVRTLEVVAIALPLLFHIVLGVLLGNTRQGAGDDTAYPRPGWMRLQRATGGFLVVFVIFHVWGIRLAPEHGRSDLFTLTSDLLEHRGLLVFHALGVLAASLHFGVGLAATLALRAPQPGRAPRRVAVAWIATAAMTLLGWNALFAFVSRSARWLEPRDPWVHAAPAPARPAPRVSTARSAPRERTERAVPARSAR